MLIAILNTFSLIMDLDFAKKSKNLCSFCTLNAEMFSYYSIHSVGQIR